MAGIVVKPRARIFHGHEWIYSSEIRKVFGNPQPGDVVSIKDYKDRPLGSGMYNPQSQIVVRRFSRRKQELSREFFVRRIQRAADYRKQLPIDPDYCRLVWSESDGLPGVIVDRYGDSLVLQTVTLGMDLRKGELVEALGEVFPDAAGIIERNDTPMRTAEGLSPEVSVLAGATPEPVKMEWNGIHFTIDLLGGQKTGLYMDQLDNYAIVGAGAAGRRVLDCFCNQGGFAQACVGGGASHVVAVDVSEDAIAQCRANAERGGIGIEAVEENAFHYLKRTQAEGVTFDLIILDPPSFTRNKRSLNDAVRGYKEIHLRALRMLEPGGSLVTFSCSHHLGHEAFLQVIADAAVDARRTLRRTASHPQRRDHPIMATIPETEYLRGFSFEVMGSW